MMISIQKNIYSPEVIGDVCHAIESAAWIWHPDILRHQPAAVQFSTTMESDGSPLRFHISADQRFTLKLDGKPLMRGPDCGDPSHWAFATYTLSLPPGRHRFTADVWWIGRHAPVTRMTVEGGFILKAEGVYHNQLTTGTAPWMAKHCPEYSYLPWKIKEYQSVGDQVCINGLLRGTGAEAPASVIATAGHKRVHGLFYNKWLLAPTSLPDQWQSRRTCGKVRAAMDQRITPDICIPDHALRHTLIPALENLLAGHTTLTIPENTCLSFVCDVEDYVCAYPQLTLSRGKDAVITWSWAEALFEKDLENKADNRNQVAGQYFTGIEDRFIANGADRQEYETHWWRAGRYMLLTIETGSEPLILLKVEIEETRYPLENNSRFSCDEVGVDNLSRVCLRGLQSHSHDIAADSPYYEQMMYTGDTRLQALIQYVTSSDNRLPRRCIELFNWSRAQGCNGLTTARYPDREQQWIPGFALIWIWMVHDYLYWRDDPAFVAEQLLAARSILNTFTTYLNSDHLLEKVPYWTFVDWTTDWFEGYPPGAREGISSLLNLQYILTLEKAAELETAVGCQGQAQIYRDQIDRTAQAVLHTFWDSNRKMMADDVNHQHFSEHGQALTVLCSAFDRYKKQEAVSALANPQAGITKASIYFSFYVFEALTNVGCSTSTAIRSRLEPWMQLPRRGFLTPPEVFGTSRSDCHAWGSHPLFHFHASILGVRPASPGFRAVSISPMDIGWKTIEGITIHPRGHIHTSFMFSANSLSGNVILPPDTHGVLNWKRHVQALAAGTNTIMLSNELLAI